MIRGSRKYTLAWVRLLCVGGKREARTVWALGPGRGLFICPEPGLRPADEVGARGG